MPMMSTAMMRAPNTPMIVYTLAARARAGVSASCSWLLASQVLPVSVRGLQQHQQHTCKGALLRLALLGVLTASQCADACQAACESQAWEGTSTGSAREGLPSVTKPEMMKATTNLGQGSQSVSRITTTCVCSLLGHLQLHGPAQVQDGELCMQ